MNSAAVRCVVFDVDDTLYLERDYVHSGLRAVGEWLENREIVSGFESLAVGLFEAGLRGRIFDEALRRLGTEPKQELVRELVAVYRNHVPQIRLLPDARECLEELSVDGRLAALTGGPVESQQRKVRELGLEALLSPVLYSGEWGPEFDKPHPRAFQAMEELIGSSGETCVYVADNPQKDFAGPKQRGWRTVRIRRSGSLHASAESGSDIDIERPDMCSLVRIVRGWNRLGRPGES